MMEGMPNQKNERENPDAAYERLKEVIKEKGKLSETLDMAAYGEWCESMERWVEAVKDVPESRRRQVEFLLKQASLYHESGDQEETASLIGQAHYIAEAEGLTDLVKKIESFT